MKQCLLVLASLLSITLLIEGQIHPFPPGMREADQLSNREEKPPQVIVKPQPTDPAQLQRDAQELASLAKLIPSEVEQLKAGQLPKDLNAHLKRIEKLSKQLRREISP